MDLFNSDDNVFYTKLNACDMLYIYSKIVSSLHVP